jgi:hypothetical protein
MARKLKKTTSLKKLLEGEKKEDLIELLLGMGVGKKAGKKRGPKKHRGPGRPRKVGRPRKSGSVKRRSSKGRGSYAKNPANRYKTGPLKGKLKPKAGRKTGKRRGPGRPRKHRGAGRPRKVGRPKGSGRKAGRPKKISSTLANLLKSKADLSGYTRGSSNNNGPWISR